MDTKEYLELSDELDKQPVPNFELSHFTHVWIKSRMPEAYAELKANFRAIEDEIYAARESRNQEPF